MAQELIAFLNFEFTQNLANIKSVSGESLAEVSRFVINWRDYQALLADLGLKHTVQDRPLFRRYLSYLSTEDLYRDLTAFQEEMRGLLREVIRSGRVPEVVWKRIFKDTDGLPMFIEPAGEGDWSLESAAAMSFHYDFSADTYRLFILAMLRGLILNRRLFSLTVDAEGKFHLPEESFASLPSQPPAVPVNAAAPSAAELRAALRAAVAKELPAALAGAVAEKLPMALAESAAEKLPQVMDALVRAKLPEALAEAVEARLPDALLQAVEAGAPDLLARAVELRLPEELAAAVETHLPEALSRALEICLPEALEAAVREQLPEAVQAAAPPLPEEGPEESAARAESPAPGGFSSGPSFSISVPGLRLVGVDSSISIPAPLRPLVEPEPEPLDDFVFLSETEIEEIEPEPLAEPLALTPEGEVPDIDPAEYAETFQEEALEEGLALFEVGGPAAGEPEEEAAVMLAPFEHDPPLNEDGYIFLPAQPGLAAFEEAAADDLRSEPEDEFIEPSDADFEEIEPAEAEDEVQPLPDETVIPLTEPLDEEDAAAIQPDETVIPLSEAVEEEETAIAAAPPDETILPLTEKVEEQEEEGWLPFLKVPSKTRAGKVPLEQRLATLEQRRKRRRDYDGQDRFDF